MPETNRHTAKQADQYSILATIAANFHVTADELCCHDRNNTPYPIELGDLESCGRLFKLLAVFESLRTHCGHRPLHVECSYRTPKHNKAVGSKYPNSYHVRGMAMDIHPPSDIEIELFHRLAKTWARKNSMVGGLGIYAWGIHFDIRPRSKSKAAVLQGPVIFYGKRVTPRYK